MALRIFLQLCILLVLAGSQGCVHSARQFATGIDEEPLPSSQILRPGDVVQIEVFREPDFSGQFRVLSEGVVRHSIMGDLAVSGLRLDEAEDMIRKHLGEKYLVNPRVILKLESSPALQVLVMGEVRRPGNITFQHGESLTLLDAISLAGGFTEKASPNRVRVLRTVDGRQVRLRVRVAKLLSGRGRAVNVKLQQGDVVTVPEIWF